MVAPGSISGVALDQAGKPVTRFSLQAKNHDTGTGMLRSFADERGRFALGELAAGPIELTLWTERGASATHSLELAPEQRLTGLSIVLAQAAAAP